MLGFLTLLVCHKITSALRNRFCTNIFLSLANIVAVIKCKDWRLTFALQNYSFQFQVTVPQSLTLIKSLVLSDSWHIAWVYVVGNYKKDCESFPVFHKFCDQKNCFYIKYKAAMTSFTNAFSKLQCHDFIQSWMDFNIMVSVILQTNFVKNRLI